MVFSSEISGFGRRSFWYALPSQLTPATLSAPRTHHRALPSALTPPFHCCQAQIGGDGDGLRRSIDEFLSQVLLLTV